MPKYGNIKSDDSGHKYLIPLDLVIEFDKLSLEIEKTSRDSDRFYDLCGEFSRKFSRYTIEGSISNLKVLIEE